MITELFKVKYLYKLKQVYRRSSVGDRKENSAEHSWGAMILADYFITSTNIYIDRLKVYEHLLYHDAHEIESGDFVLHPGLEHTGREEKELEGIRLLGEKLPACLKEKYLQLMKEWEEESTQEAKFAKAVDVLDSQLHEVDYKEDWKGWSEQFLRDKKEHVLKEFSQIHEAFEELLNYLNENGYFDQ